MYFSLVELRCFSIVTVTKYGFIEPWQSVNAWNLLPCVLSPNSHEERKDGMDPNRTVPHPTKLKRLVANFKDLGSLKKLGNIKIELGKMRN